jgi:hypothetical protein
MRLRLGYEFRQTGLPSRSACGVTESAGRKPDRLTSGRIAGGRKAEPLPVAIERGERLKNRVGQ